MIMPKPLTSLNHCTTPVSIASSPLDIAPPPRSRLSPACELPGAPRRLAGPGGTAVSRLAVRPSGNCRRSHDRLAPVTTGHGELLLIDNVCAAVFRPRSLVVTQRDRPLLAKAHGSHLPLEHAQVHEYMLHRVRTPLAEREGFWSPAVFSGTERAPAASPHTQASLHSCRHRSRRCDPRAGCSDRSHRPYRSYFFFSSCITASTYASLGASLRQLRGGDALHRILDR
jgi:hypothetical protein